MLSRLAVAGSGVMGGLMWGSVFAHDSDPKALSSTEFRQLPLTNAYDESPDSKVLRFAFPSPDMEAGMKAPSYVVLKYRDSNTGEEVMRPYTPITRCDQRGYFDVLVKRYKNSKMGSHLHKLKKGQTIEVKGPYEKMTYTPNMFKRIGLIAAGTGITPMYQLIREVCVHPKDKTEISLIYTNRKKEDMLLGNELNELLTLHPQFSPYFTLTQPPEKWMGGVGHVAEAQVKALMPPPSRTGDSIIMVCGPTKMMEAVCGEKDYSTRQPTQGELKGLLKEMGYTAKQIFKF